MPMSDITIVPQMSQDGRVRVYRGSRLRVSPNNFSGPTEFDGMEVDCYLLTTDRFRLLCDTSIRPEDMAVIFEDISVDPAKKPLLVMNSHADWDHSWGNSYFTGERTAPIIAHEHCRTRLQSEREQTLLADFQRSYPNHFHAVVLTPPTITFPDRLSLAGGDLTIELFSAPGHCRDHIAAWIAELRLLLAFDAVETPLPLIKNVAGVQDMFSTLEHFASLQPQRVLCSHGGTTSPRIINANLTYFREIERRCRAVLQQRLPTEKDLEQAAALIDYSLDEVAADASRMIEIPEPLDRPFYSGAHNNNIRYIMQWLMS
ncbi:MBL fold metallo-hydrolase [Dictyobacter aurantiacus]|uniref:Metallo-beta-lactamase domain-containing protein n=1 Tax=Dictyobacter aurantiacus TaxID=1936993 RepID=A0A401ZM78_9CHLR|nr:MBL fold metallo-hydrolase [Dictyobacter aurantiacus]GCE07975.1 hypothetical protein KDAU_53040 [Dictyobacter aurantiacus]